MLEILPRNTSNCDILFGDILRSVGDNDALFADVLPAIGYMKDLEDCPHYSAEMKGTDLRSSRPVFSLSALS